MWWPSENGPPGTIYPDSSFDVAAVPVAPGTNTLTATYTGPAFTNVPMTATATSTVILGDKTYTHDANGNLTSDATFTYQYDTANQLTNVIRKSDSVSVLQCRYDALGRRVEAIRFDGTVDRYVYFPGSFLVLAVLDATNASKEFYTRGPDLAGSLDGAGGIGGILACTYASGPILYHHADLLGNVIALTDTSGIVHSTFRYTPFGQLSTRTGSAIPRHLFNSKEKDTRNNLYYYGRRYYYPTLLQWLIRDPVGEMDSLNLYMMCQNQTINLLDAWGCLSQYQKDLYKAIDQAGRAAVEAMEADYSSRLKRYRSLPRQNSMFYNPPQRREFCGRVCLHCNADEKTYILYHTKPMAGREQVCQPHLTPYCENGDVQVGIYHSHPAADGLSQKDIGVADAGIRQKGQEKAHPIPIGATWQRNNPSWISKDEPRVLQTDIYDPLHKNPRHSTGLWSLKDGEFE